jgi:hypothetical protein
VYSRRESSEKAPWHRFRIKLKSLWNWSSEDRSHVSGLSSAFRHPPLLTDQHRANRRAAGKKFRSDFGQQNWKQKRWDPVRRSFVKQRLPNQAICKVSQQWRTSPGTCLITTEEDPGPFFGRRAWPNATKSVRESTSQNALKSQHNEDSPLKAFPFKLSRVFARKLQDNPSPHATNELPRWQSSRTAVHVRSLPQNAPKKNLSKRLYSRSRNHVSSNQNTRTRTQECTSLKASKTTSSQEPVCTNKTNTQIA